MKELLWKGLHLGLGAATIGKERAKRIVNELEKKGAITAKEGTTLVKRVLREAQKELHKLRIRVEQGVREELLPLLQLRGIGRVRGRKLYANGIKTIAEVKNASLTTLSQILGKKVAEEVQKQVGEDITPIPAGTRKGQRSLGKY